MKAVISNKIYLIADNKTLAGVKKELTYELPPKYTAPGQPSFPIIIRSYKILDKDMIAFPSGRVDLIPKEAAIVDNRVFVPKDYYPDFRFSLRANQEEMQNKAIELDKSLLLHAKPGWGKTFWGISLSSHLKQKTLIITHTSLLMEQWLEEIEKCLGIPKDDIGKVTDGCKFIGENITVGTIQSIVKYIDEISKEFGLVIMDEVHHLPADTFMIVMNGLHAYYKIGMTGTLRRTDKKEKLIFDYFSKDVLKAKDENVMIPEVIVMRLPIDFNKDYDNGLPYATKINMITSSDKYIESCVEVISALDSKGYRVLFIGDRVAAVEAIAEHVDSMTPITAATKNRDVIFDGGRKGSIKHYSSTVRLFSEGISENYLSALVLGAFISSDVVLEQLVGRITRLYPGKLNPVIIDLSPRGRTMNGQLSERLEFYEAQGWDITYADS